MPASKKTLVPGPFTPAGDIKRADFRFDDVAVRELRVLLPTGLHQPAPSPPTEQAAAIAAAKVPMPETYLDWIMMMTREQVLLLVSSWDDDTRSRAAAGSPATYRAAIRKLRHALRPFVDGSMDAATCRAVDWHAIDRVLDQRDVVLALEPRVRTQDRARNDAVGRIARGVQEWASRASVVVDERTVMRFVHRAFSAAGINLPDPDEHADRLRKLVFPGLNSER